MYHFFMAKAKVTKHSIAWTHLDNYVFYKDVYLSKKSQKF